MQDDGPTEDSTSDTTTETVTEKEQRQARQRAVRDKLQQLYGDDSAETVRRFLYQLTGGDKPDIEDGSDHPDTKDGGDEAS